MARVVKAPEERKREIIEMAKKHFMEYGIEKAQIGKITKELGASYGLVYHYFDSKDELVDAVIDSIYEDGMDMVKDVMADSELTPLEKFHKLFGLIDSLPYNADFLAGEISKLGDSDEIRTRLAQRRATLFVPIIEQLIKDGCENGYFDCKYPIAVAAFCVHGEIAAKSYLIEMVGIDETIATLKDLYGRVLGIKGEK